MRSRRERIRVAGNQGSRVPAGKAAGVGSFRELARRVGVSHTSVREWVRHEAWPFGTGPWGPEIVDQAKGWAAATLSPDPSRHAGQSIPAGGEGSMAKAKLALTIEKFKSERTRREILLKQFHRIDQCEARRARQVLTVRNELLAVPLRCPFGPDVRAWLEGEMRRVCEEFASGGGSGV